MISSLAERALADGAGSMYVQMHQRGELIIAGERVSDIRALLLAALDRWGPSAVIVCDRWREAELPRELEAVRFPMAHLVVPGMGFKDGAEDVRAFRAACFADKVHPRLSLLLRATMAEARAVTDPAGNQKLSKGTEGGRRMTAKDDAAPAAILAVAIRARHQGGPRRPIRHTLAG